MSSAIRYQHRISIWKRRTRILPSVRHHAWWVVHNCLAHPVLGLRATKSTVWFHDWTSMRLCKRDQLRPSPLPEVSRTGAWLWHNVAGHVAIGLVPCRATFAFHDRTSRSMDVPHWL